MLNKYLKGLKKNRCLLQDFEWIGLAAECVVDGLGAAAAVVHVWDATL